MKPRTEAREDTGKGKNTTKNWPVRVEGNIDYIAFFKTRKRWVLGLL